MAVPILIAQSNYLIREGIKSLIINYKEYIFKGEALSSEDLLFLINSFDNGVVIIDHNDPAFGISTIRKAKAIAPGVHFLSISDKPNRWMLSDAIAAGITSYLLRDGDKNEFIEAIEATAKGGQFFCGKILTDVLKFTDEVSLETEFISCEGVKISNRETEIISLISDGLSNKQIAEKLFLSVHTVTTHRKKIMSKLGVNNTAGLVLFAIKNNIVSPNHLLFNTN